MSHRHLSLAIPPKNRRSASTSANTSFCGEFTLATRERFRQLRRELGLSLQQLAEYLKINWSTIRKWEAGLSRKCHARHVSRITNFLNHCYDERLRELNEPNGTLVDIMRQLPLPLRSEIENVWTTYGVSRCYPGESDRFTLELNRLVDEIAHEILAHCLETNPRLGLEHIPHEVAEDGQNGYLFDT